MSQRGQISHFLFFLESLGSEAKKQQGDFVKQLLHEMYAV